MSLSKAVSGHLNFPDSITQRLQVKHLLEPTKMVSTTAGSDVIQGLKQTPKTLPFKYLYDDRGSELFEQICDLPEYYPTRTETKILQNYSTEIAQITGACELVELGSGSSTKTRILLDAYQELNYPLHYLPIDVSAGILELSAKQLLKDYPTLQVYALAGTYEQALTHLQPTKSPTRIIAFIGSSLGNMSPQECDRFFNQITDALHPGEYFLLGIDLQKPKDILEAAYDDRQGVTAEFNLNMLRHLNRRFEGDFDPNQFSHWAFYNEVEQRIEMHLKSAIAQTVELRSLNLKANFTAGETIRTEISRKFDLDTIQQDLQAHGLIPQQVWTDENQWFGLILSRLS
ncbi:MAG: L-histidine N(alpha)-methyltransferase [Calothrix sp. MO_167.B12]|nr:L-histidine N(alpha)-methyltransferase [Calothrix sp. MO_167.B12]